MPSLDAVSRRGFTAASLALLAGCRLNKLPQYHSRLHKAFLVVDVAQPGTVDVGGGSDRATDEKKGIVAAAASIAEGIIGLKLQGRLREVMPPQRVSALIAEVMVARMSEIELEHVSLKEMPDTRMDFRVNAFGIRSASDLEPVSYHFDFRTLLVYEPEGKKIWRFSRQLGAPISDVHVAAWSNSAVGDISNAVALDNLETAELEAVMIAMVQDATNLFMEQLAYDFYKAKMGRR
ncbi:MAG: hypothetical protein R3A79_21840 [Nannocystaceae bacterium]